MFKSPIRNHRSKGVKVKQVLQICFLLAICFWLIYQVKHSHDKKKALDETDANKQTVRRTIPSGDILKLGRKDVNPKLEQPELINGKSNEETEDIEENVGEEEDNEIESVTEEEAEDKDDEIGRDGVDELEKSDSEVDREEKDAEDSDESLKNEKSLKEKNVEDETKSSIHESRDENYKADDASSAVTQTSRFIGSETEVEILKKSTGKDSLADENLNLAGNISSNNVVEEREIAETTKSDPVEIVAQNGNEIPADIASRDVIAETASETRDSGNVSLDLKKPVSKQAEGNTQFSDIKSDVIKAEAKPDTDVKALTIDDDDALNAENGGEVQRDSINSDSGTSLVRKDDGTDMEMLANVLNEDSNEEEAAAE